MSDNEDRNCLLDVLRGTAVCLVLFRHMGACPAETSPFLHWASSVLVRGGWVGVDLFFVLSGFLVSGLLFREFQRHGTVTIWQFLVRRGLKIYPAFVVFVLVMLVVDGSQGQMPEGRRVFAELLFLRNYLGGVHTHTWSLDVEEHFYILLSLVLALLAGRHVQLRNPFRSVPALFVVLAVASLIVRCVNGFFLPYSHRTHLFPSHVRLDALFTGVFVAYLCYFHHDRFVRRIAGRKWLMVIAGVLLLSPAFVYELEVTPWLSSVGLSMFSLGAALVLMACLEGKSAGERRLNPISRAIALIGVYSYSIYLWHVAARYVAERLMGYIAWEFGWFLHVLAYVVAALAIGIGMAKLVEMPVLRLRNHLLPSRSGPIS